MAQRQRNLQIARERGRLWRCPSESDAIRRLIQQWALAPAPKLPVRALARKLSVWPSYVRRTRDKALRVGVDTELRATWEELARARELTELGRFREPDMFAPIRPAPPPRPTGVHVSVEEYERQRRKADQAATLERLRERLARKPR